MIKPSLTQVLPFAVCTVILSSCGKKQPEQQQTNHAIRVSTQEVQQINRIQSLSYTGSIEPDNTSKIGFAVAGVINQVVAKEGQFVRQGQLLASIDATEYENALIIAKAGLEQAEDMYQRLNDLYQKGSLPAKDFIDIKTKVAQAQANKNINTKHIADSKLHAPISGIITEKLVEKGSMAAPGVPAFSIIKTDKVFAKITVPEAEIGNFKQGMTASVFIPTLNESIKGTISIINPQADAISKTYIVKIQLNNPQNRILPGMISNVEINPNRVVPALSIPANAVVRDADDITYVYVMNGEKKVLKKRVTVGSLIGSKEVIIKEGLNKDERIVIEGQTKLHDGSEVQL